MMHKKIILFSVLLVSLLMMMFVVSGCGDLKGDPTKNVLPSVGFVTVPVDSSLFTYAPEVRWMGSDPDGFVEFYSFADITDQSAILSPVEFIDQIPEEAWRDTISHSATVYLLSEVGDTTEHIFYIRCTDNDGAKSAVKYRTFFRSNNEPNIPIIGVTGIAQSQWATRYPNPVANDTSTVDTFFTAPQTNGFYPGIQFSWLGTDPDDKVGAQIPLEYQAVLIKSPSDTVFKQSWNDDVDITLIDLETGFYTLNVWCRDDGLTLSDAPARAEFNVVKPTFENNLLMVIEATGDSVSPGSLGSWPETDSLDAFYPKLLRDVVESGALFVNLDLADTNDVRIVNLHDFNDSMLSLSLVSKYKLVIFISDQIGRSVSVPSIYINERREILDPYLRVGGRTWYLGRNVHMNMTSMTGTPTDPNDIFMNQFFDVRSVVPTDYSSGDLRVNAEMIGTQRALSTLSNNLTFDSLKFIQNYGPDTLFVGNGGGYSDSLQWGQTAVDYIQRRAVAQTTQYIKSNTVGRSDSTWSEDSDIVEDVNYGSVTGLNPPTSTMCFIATDHELVKSVSRIFNVTRQTVGELASKNNNILRVSYNEMHPWEDDDVIEIDYTYNAISDFSLRPCEIRYESVYASGLFNSFFQLNFRTALTSFSYYLMEEEDVTEAWVEMLNWFYYPTIH
jgi:hypothetical protein